MTTATVRLHITPLTPSTAASILPASATSVSFHTIETFPEKSYGFATLPAPDAQQLKKKLHGAMFRGVKASITEARPGKWVDSGDGEGEERKRKKRKKVKEQEQGVVDGFQLPTGRQVKRGWEKNKCVVNVVVPENKRSVTKDGKEKKKETKEEKKARKKLRKQVKEFEKSKKFMGFLKESKLDDSRGREVLVGEYVDGVGWVDGEGKVVEKAREEKEKPRKNPMPEPQKEPSPAPGEAESPEESGVEMEVDQDPHESARSSSAEVESESEVEAPAKPTTKDHKKYKTVSPKEDSESSSEEEEEDPESESDSNSDSDDEGTIKEAPNPTKTKRKAASPSSISSEDDASEADSSSSSESDIEEATKTPTSKPTLAPLSIHPLQAIYKPTTLATASTAEDTFKFGFGGGGDDDSDSDTAPTFQTPYRDPLRYRSAAPTPDTAVGNKRFFSPDESALRTPVPFTPTTNRAGVFVPTTPQVRGGEPLLFPHSDSAFLHGMSVWSSLPSSVEDAETWKAEFYEQRGEWNRDWKRRRREAVKAKRRRERARRPA